MFGAALQVPASPPPASAHSPCLFLTNTLSHPERVLLGETVGLTVSAVPYCHGVPLEQHYVFVLDASASMAGGPLRDLAHDLRRLVDDLRLDFYVGTKVAVVVHRDGGAETLCRLSNDRLAVVGCLGRVTASGEPNHGAALREARDLLAHARDPEAWMPPQQVIVMVSGPTLDSGCGNAVREAGAINRDGVLLMTACAADACATSCVRRLATRPRYSFERIDDPYLLNTLKMIRNADHWVLVKRLTLDLHLGDDVVGIVGSAMPMPVLEYPESGHVRWSTAFVPREGITLSLMVRPQRVGRVSTVATATLAFSDNLNHGGVMQLDVPSVMVLDPRAVPTATSVATVVPTATAEPSPTPVETPATPASRWRLALPHLLSTAP